MASEALWHDTCPICGGTGQIETTKDRKTGNDIALICDACNGKGTILIVKKIRKKGK
jgi:DnaJ-class molecular chaperone